MLNSLAKLRIRFDIGVWLISGSVSGERGLSQIQGVSLRMFSPFFVNYRSYGYAVGVGDQCLRAFRVTLGLDM